MTVGLMKPVMLGWLLVALVALALFIFGFWRKRQTLRQFTAPEPIKALTNNSQLRQWLRALCLVGAIFLLAISLAMPHWGTRSHDFVREGRDFIIMLDVSLSMQAQDAKPNRLQSALVGIREFVQTIRQEGGHRIGLIVFAGRASPMVPLTADYNLFVNRLDEVGLTAIRRGSQIGDAIRQALYGFGVLEHTYTDLILITDGEDHGSGAADVAKVAAKLGVTIHAIGVGDPQRGAPIPFKKNGIETFVKINETQVISKMQPGVLIELVRLTGGEYVSSGPLSMPLSGLYKRRLADQPRRQIDVTASEQPIHRFQWFIGTALVLILLEMALGVPGGSNTPARRRAATRVLLISTLTAGLLVAIPSPLYAASVEVRRLISQGNEKYRDGDFHAAVRLYGQALELAPDSALIHFNYATARFKLYDYGGAIEHFTLALQVAGADMQPSITYNLGVVKHQQAIGNMMTFQDALTPLNTSIDYYRESLNKAPDLANTRYNLELAHRLSQDIKNQRVLPQSNAKTRDQKTSDNKGQLGKEKGDKATEAMPEQQAEQQQESAQSPTGSVSMPQNKQTAQEQSSLAQRGEATEMNQEQAMREVELSRERALSSAEQRHQRRKARMQADQVRKFW